jgi:hypothetical protein
MRQFRALKSSKNFRDLPKYAGPMTMESGYSLILHFFTLSLNKNPKLYF